MYEIVTPNPHMEGAMESDTIGENRPRSLAECEADIAALLDGACGGDFADGDYYIRDCETGELVA